MHLTRDQFAAWLDRYLAAWRSGDTDEIGELFSDDVVYSQNGGQTSITGREAVVAHWLEAAYEPEAEWEASYEPLAIEEQVHVAQCELDVVVPGDGQGVGPGRSQRIGIGFVADVAGDEALGLGGGRGSHHEKSENEQ